MEAQSPCALRPECAVDRRAARAHPNLCEVAPSACQGKADSRARAHHRRRIAGKPAACPAGRAARPCRRGPLAAAPPDGLPPGAGQYRAGGDGAHLQLRRRHGRGGRGKPGLVGDGGAGGGGRDGVPHRRDHGSAKGLHGRRRSEEHTSELQSLMRISYDVFCLKKKKKKKKIPSYTYIRVKNKSDRKTKKLKYIRIS